VAPGSPPEHARKAYAQQEVAGVKVYFSPGMILNQRALQLKLGGFWRFRWLNVSGVGMPPGSCCS